MEVMLKNAFPLLLLLCACGGSSDSSTTDVSSAQVPDFGWMVGTWQRIEDKPGRATYEQWGKASETLYLGLSYTMVGNDTAWQEEMRLVGIDDDWTLEVNGEGQTIPFHLTNTEPGAFVSENPAHDFPKAITYKILGDTLAATISGGGKEVPFTFLPKH